MTLRSDHVAGAALIGLGLLVVALSGDLPFGSLAMPGSGFVPNILAVLTIGLGGVLCVRASESPPLAEIAWSDGKHAALIVAITAAAIALFERLGFVTTMALMLFVLLVGIERRSPLAAALFSLGAVAATYATFEYVLKTPLVTGPFGF